jgi:hypothetical protein
VTDSNKHDLVFRYAHLCIDNFFFRPGQALKRFYFDADALDKLSTSQKELPEREPVFAPTGPATGIDMRTRHYLFLREDHHAGYSDLQAAELVAVWPGYRDLLTADV